MFREEAGCGVSFGHRAVLGTESRWVSAAQGTDPGPRVVTGRKISPQKKEVLSASLCFFYSGEWAVVRKVCPCHGWACRHWMARWDEEYGHRNVSPVGHSGETVS